MEQWHYIEYQLVAQSIIISKSMLKNPQNKINYQNQAVVFYGGNLC